VCTLLELPCHRSPIDLRDHNAIDYRDASHFDLHNLFDFEGLFLGSDRTATLRFVPNVSFGNDQPSVHLEFRHLSVLVLSPGFGTSEVVDLEEMGYMSPDQSDDSWLLSEHQADESAHLFFRFSSGSIRICAESASLNVGEPGGGGATPAW
jgi:hypothetical protein